MLTKEDFEKDAIDDRFIYHYTNYSCAIKNILKNNELLFNKVSKTDDPFEFVNILHHASCQSNIDFNEKIKLLQIGNASNDIVKNKFKICCFCSDKKIDASTINKGYCRARMWSQYGNAHKGVCLVFNKDKLLNIIKNKFDSVFAKQISYKNNMVDLFDITDIKYERDRNADPLERTIKYINEYLFQKLDDYKDEQEYRIAVYPDNDCDNILIDFEDSLEGIILGVKFPKAHEIRIKNSTKLPVFKMKWLNGYPIVLGVDDEFPVW